MRKLCICIFLILVLAVGVFAAPQRIVDEAGLLTASEIDKLERMADSIASSCNMDVVVVTVDSLDGKTAQAYADDYFDNNGYGLGTDNSGTLLLVAMQEREWAVSTCGIAIRAVKGHEIDDIMDNILPDLSSGDYYEVFSSFLVQIEAEYTQYASGEDTDGFTFGNVIIALIIGAVVACIALLIMRSSMNTAKQQHGARNYICDGTYDLFRCHDIYLYSRTSKVKKPENSSGGGSHRSSSGRSHGGRSGRF